MSKKSRIKSLEEKVPNPNKGKTYIQWDESVKVPSDLPSEVKVIGIKWE